MIRLKSLNLLRHQRRHCSIRGVLTGSMQNYRLSVNKELPLVLTHLAQFCSLDAVRPVNFDFCKCLDNKAVRNLVFWYRCNHRSCCKSRKAINLSLTVSAAVLRNNHPVSQKASI